ncbi:MAG: IS1380 family transposase, partial [Gammaproteobacteria bacterium]|nr:IS1380 family transposase [Gammaproteobacteria bacterium]
IDIDGTIAPTYGECKDGMDISYKGIWGYAPLIITLANTKEVLYLVNRSGNVPSHDGAAEWIDRAIELVKPFSKRICLRGDTDFSLTSNFDKWSNKVDFVFGMDACPGFVRRAQQIPQEKWKVLRRAAKYKVKTKKRDKPERVKEQIVRERAFKNIRLESEHVTEFDYSPTKCKKVYRMVVVRKNLNVEKGQHKLFDDVRYFFYITTRRDLSVSGVVKLANKRCDQENVIEQLKNGVNAMRMPVRDLNSNWAYMIIAALAWNLKAWYGLLMPDVVRGTQILKMEFRGFLHKIILMPYQIIKRGRRIIYRALGYNDWLKDFFNTWELIRQLKCT